MIEKSGGNRGDLHENLSREEAVPLPSERNFGLTMAAAFGFIFILAGMIAGRWHAWLVVASIAFLLAGMFYPVVLRPLNRLWMRLGLALHAVVNPVVLAALFCFITLIGIAWRMAKRDPLRLKFDASARSYWIERKPPGPDSENFPYQF